MRTLKNLGLILSISLSISQSYADGSTNIANNSNITNSASTGIALVTSATSSGTPVISACKADGLNVSCSPIKISFDPTSHLQSLKSAKGVALYTTTVDNSQVTYAYIVDYLQKVVFVGKFTGNALTDCTVASSNLTLSGPLFIQVSPYANTAYISNSYLNPNNNNSNGQIVSMQINPSSGLFMGVPSSSEIFDGGVFGLAALGGNISNQYSLYAVINGGTKNNTYTTANYINSVFEVTNTKNSFYYLTTLIPSMSVGAATLNGILYVSSAPASSDVITPINISQGYPEESVTFTSTPGGASGMAISDNFLYTVDNGGILACSLANGLNSNNCQYNTSSVGIKYGFDIAFK